MIERALRSRIRVVVTVLLCAGLAVLASSPAAHASSTNRACSGWRSVGTVDGTVQTQVCIVLAHRQDGSHSEAYTRVDVTTQQYYGPFRFGVKAVMNETNRAADGSTTYHSFGTTSRSTTSGYLPISSGTQLLTSNKYMWATVGVTITDHEFGGNRSYSFTLSSPAAAVS